MSKGKGLEGLFDGLHFDREIIFCAFVGTFATSSACATWSR